MLKEVSPGKGTAGREESKARRTRRKGVVRRDQGWARNDS
jgi:hypothetical protein